MDNNKVLRGGVAPGGLFTKENIRIMLCYLLTRIDDEISKTAFADILQGTELANYFEISDALSFLENNGMVTITEKEGDIWYRITESGRHVSENLSTELPLSAREKAYAIGARVVNREKMSRGTEVEIRRIDGDDCNVIMTIYDGNKKILMQTTLYAADYMQAEVMAQRFRDDPSKLYLSILDTLTE